MAAILLICDDPAIARLTSRVIERHGYNIMTMTDCSENISEKPDLIIFDCGMSPDEGLKKYNKIINICFPTKILWVSSDPADEILALEAGADDWIRKPYNVDVFLVRIKKLCKKVEKK